MGNPRPFRPKSGPPLSPLQESTPLSPPAQTCLVSCTELTEVCLLHRAWLTMGTRAKRILLSNTPRVRRSPLSRADWVALPQPAMKNSPDESEGREERFQGRQMGNTRYWCEKTCHYAIPFYLIPPNIVPILCR